MAASAVPRAYFVPRGENVFAATPFTVGPWSGKLQHAGPPSALVARAFEQKARELGHPLVPRLSMFILKPIPAIDALFAVDVSIIRKGAAVSHLEASLKLLKKGGQGDEVIRAHAVCYRESTIDDLPRLAVQRAGIACPPSPEASAPVSFPTGWWNGASEHGYNKSMTLKIAGGDGISNGPCAIWSRVEVAVVEGEVATPLQRLIAFADSGNGVSACVPPATVNFMNCDVTLHLNRMPRGDWMCLDARTDMSTQGFGLATTRLFDAEGFIGTSNQSLFVSPFAKSPTKL